MPYLRRRKLRNGYGEACQFGAGGPFLMRLAGDIVHTRPKVGGLQRDLSISPPARRSCRALYWLFAGIVATALAGCTNGAGSLLVDPGHYSAYHCNDLAAQWKVLVAREKELRDLMDRANQGGGGGAVIGSLAYRADYESVRSDEKLVQREAAEKNCNSTTQFQSDQAIR